MSNNTRPHTLPATLGLDVGDRFTSFCFVDANGDVADEGKVRTRDGDLRERLLPFKRIPTPRCP